MKRILCPYCGHNLWRWKTEDKLISFGDIVRTKKIEYRVCIKCQKKLK